MTPIEKLQTMLAEIDANLVRAAAALASTHNAKIPNCSNCANWSRTLKNRPGDGWCTQHAFVTGQFEECSDHQPKP